MSKLIDMKLPKRSTKNKEVACSIDDGEKYPYGLRIELRDDELKKLGIKTLPSTGTQLIVAGIGSVISASERQSMEGTRRDISIQLERIDVGRADGGDMGPVEAVEKALGKS